ncbi:MAG: metal-sensitive transcriptional regulator [Candidatus Peribacteria bacterium]|jgi:DNA-binding FrmR family transcriptional regulator|nr:metal-sensitive transcriptional regulator [Candidatus Peribacteria bacterium]
MKDCCPSSQHHDPCFNSPYHPKALIAIKKSKSLLSKIEKMIEEKAYCADISQQVNAVIGMMQSLNSSVLKDHLMSCGVRELSSNDPQHMETFIEELVRVRGIGTRK